MKNFGKLSGVLVILLFVLAACGGETQGGDEPIRVGVAVSVTGPASSLGEAQRNAVQLFREEYDEIDGQPVEWIVEDTATNPTTAVTTVNRLAQDEEVAAIICCSVSPDSMAILPTVEQQSVPNVSLAAAASIVEPVDEREWVFKTTHNDAAVTDMLTDYMAEQGHERVAFLGFNDAYGESGASAFEQSAGEKGLTVAGSESFNREDNDITAQITSLRNGNPDAYLIWGIPPGAVTAQQDLARLGIEAPVYHSHGSYNGAFLELGSGAVEDVLLAAEKTAVAASLPEGDPQQEVITTFREAYEEEYGEGSASVFAAMTYDAMGITYEAASRALEAGADPSDLPAFREALREEIENTSDFVGTMGTFDYSPEDHGGLGTDGLVMLQISDNEFTLLEE